MSDYSQVFIWGVPRIDYMSVIRDRTELSDFKGRLSKDQSLVDFSVQMGGCVLLEQILGRMVSSNIKVASNIGLSKDGDRLSQEDLLEEYADPRKPNATINWTRWHKVKADGWAAPSEAESVLNYRIAGPSGYEMGRELNPSEYLEKNGIAKSLDPDQTGGRLLIFVDRGWNYDGTVPAYALNAGERFHHIIASLDATGTLENSVGYRLFKNCARKVTFVTTLSDLRQLDNVSLGLSLSWERTVQDVVAAVVSLFGHLDDYPERHAYSRVIVMVDLCGAIIVDLDESGKANDTTLIFDQLRQEGDYLRESPGRVIGHTVTLLAAIAATLITFPTHQDHKKLWALAVRCGLSSQRFLHNNGFELEDIPGERRKRLLFPFTKLSDHFLACVYEAKRQQQIAVHPAAIAQAKPLFTPEWTVENMPKSRDKDLMTFQYRPDGSDSDLWTILGEQQYDKNATNELEKLERRQRIYDTADRIVHIGRRALNGIPVERIGDWSSADRQEIEGVRAVSNAIRNYMVAPGEKPLSIAVFGPPGSGKSFVVKQIAKAQSASDKYPPDRVLTDKGSHDIAIREFNLSQYESVHELAKAFHVVRDLSLRRKLPLIFWDEFDTPFPGTLGWLRHFLAPMQDGSFSELGVTHPVGPGIYVFAGGTYSSYGSFVTAKVDPQTKKNDFVSRLSAYINVKGPNGEPNTLEDPLLPIRRAFLLRSQILSEAPHISTLIDGESEPEIAITESVLAAFIRTAVYRHGARSMENIIKRSKLDDKVRFSESSLPPEPILTTHVDARNFTDYATGACEGRLRIGIRWEKKSGGQLSQFCSSARLHLNESEAHACNALTIVIPVPHIPAVQASLSIIEAMMEEVPWVTVLGSNRIFMPRVMVVLPMPKDEFIRQNSRDDPSGEFAVNNLLDAAHEVIVIPSVRDTTRPAIRVKAIADKLVVSDRLCEYVKYYSDTVIDVDWTSGVGGRP